MKQRGEVMNLMTGLSSISSFCVTESAALRHGITLCVTHSEGCNEISLESTILRIVYFTWLNKI